MASPTLSPEEVQKRAPVWAALSNLFVDTDVGLLRRHIAAELSACGYNDAELLQILRKEAGPTFAPNLLLIAGEWVGWNSAEAQTKVLSFLSRPSVVREIQRVMMSGLIERAIANHWSSIRSLRILEREP